MKTTKHYKKNKRIKNITKKLKKTNKITKNRKNKKQNKSLKKGGSGKPPIKQVDTNFDRTPEHDTIRDRFLKKLTYNNEEYQFIFINLINSLKKRLNEMKKNPKPEEDAIIKQILTKFIIFFSDPDVITSNFVIGMLLDTKPKYKLVIYKPSIDNSFFPYCKEFIYENINKYLNYNLYLTTSYLSVIYDSIDDQNICIYLTYILYKTIQRVVPPEAVSLITDMTFFNLTTPIEVAIETNKLRLVGVLMYIIDRNRRDFQLDYYGSTDYFPYIRENDKEHSKLLSAIRHNFFARSNPIKHFCMFEHKEEFCNTYIRSVALDYMDKVYTIINFTNAEVEKKIRENNITPIYFKNFGDYVDNLDRKIKPNDKKEFWEFYYKAFSDIYERDPELLNIEITTSEKHYDDTDLISAFDAEQIPSKGKQSSKNKTTKKAEIKKIETTQSITKSPEQVIKDLPKIEETTEKETKEDTTELPTQEDVTYEPQPEYKYEPSLEEIIEPPQTPEINSAFYSNEELKFLKRTINSFMINSLTIDTKQGICGEIKTIIKNYSIKETLDSSDPRKPLTETELKEYNIMACAIFIIIGLLSYKLNQHGDYQLIVKGGKGLQLSFSDFIKYNYESEDIDLLLLNKKNIDDYENKLKLSIYIGELIKWIIEVPIFKNIGFLNPSQNRTNKYVGKISYINTNKKLVILDIDIKYPVDNVQEKLKMNDFEYIKLNEFGFPLGINFYNFEQDDITLKTFPFRDLTISFFYQKTDIALQEKIYIYTKYFILIEIIKTTNYSNTTPTNIIMQDPTIQNYNRFLQKFKRSIRAIFFYLYERNAATDGPYKQLQKYKKKLSQIISLETKPNLTQEERTKIGTKSATETEISRYETSNNQVFKEYAKHEYFNHLIYKGSENEIIFDSIIN